SADSHDDIAEGMHRSPTASAEGSVMPRQKSTPDAATTIATGGLMRDGMLGGSEATFVAMAESLCDELAPRDVLETLLIERVIQAVWRLRRAARAETDAAL